MSHFRARVVAARADMDDYFRLTSRVRHALRKTRAANDAPVRNEAIE